ncbi:MAG TPA: GPW/gp25 family protein [Mycobacterium sp.]
MTAVDRAFLGVGWAFPPAAASGDVEMAAYEEDVRQAVLIILQTAPGERLMRPGFGAGLSDLVFEPMSTALLALVKHRVETALIQWEPRIDVDAVDVTASPPHGRIDIDIRYHVRQTSTFYNLVYPFYLNEGGGQ